ncbi:KH domain-containing protein [Candidatus Berkelbacteria bacterium]|nr:KH domain-containing protein [Candidatus Berkelbacteria bacterium]
MEKDQQFVEMVVKELVDHPEDVKVERRVDEMGVLLTLSVNPEDMGKIIGKEGRTAKSIRTLLRVLGARNNSRVNLKIEDPAGGRVYSPGDDSASDQPTDQPVAQVSDDVVAATTASDDTSAAASPADDQPALEPATDGLSQINDVTEQQDENPTSIL